MIALDVPRAVGICVLLTGVLAQAHLSKVTRDAQSAVDDEATRRADVLGFWI
jgi:hypothetical protein|tara:strand:+ start:2067 stop:2222 length:156 start_codon:yes stop_codon:yes gene_type:complete